VLNRSPVIRMSRRNSLSTVRVIGPLVRFSRTSRLQHFVAPVLALVVCALLLAIFQHLSRAVNYRAVVHELHGMTFNAWAGALVATALSYAAMVGRDAVGLRYLDVKVPRPVLWVGATVASALGNATGFGALTGGAVRCRVYGVAGVTPAQVGRLTVFTSVTLALALLLMTAIGMLCSADTLAGMLHLSQFTLQCSGAAILAVFAAMILLCGASPRTLQSRWRWLAVTIPARRDLVAQLLLAALDVAAASLALWSVLPHAQIGLGVFVTVFSAAMLLGMIGHTPGGVGVFEAAMMLALGANVNAPELLAALLAYRAIYFGLPLIVATAVLAIFEGRALKGRFAFLNPSKVSQLAPLFLSVVTFVVGGMLVISGATPAFGQRLTVLQAVLPLWVLESSQLLGSVLGVVLLFVARGLLRRLDAAWWLAMALAVANLALSLAKGLAFFEVGVLCLLIVLLLATRDRFNRRSSLLTERFTASWLVSVAMVIGLAVWIMLFAFRDGADAGGLGDAVRVPRRALYPRPVVAIRLRRTRAARAARDACRGPARRRHRHMAVAAAGRRPL
jgi:phosphatidylglycerol lysyltransferase